LIYAIQYTGQINRIQPTRAASGNGGRFLPKPLDTVRKWAYSANSGEINMILKLQNVGLLQDATQNGAVDLARVTAIYADNGRGKLTLAVLRA
jgi:hypothetical protein